MDYSYISKFLADYEKQNAGKIQAIQSYISANKSNISSITKYTQAFNKNSPLFEGAKKQLSDFAESISQSINIRLLDSFTSLINAQEQYKENERKYVIILTKCGWPPLWDIPVHYIRTIIKAFDSTPFDIFQKNLNERIIEFYNRETFNEMLNRWSKVELINKRLPILQDVIKAHLLKDYTLSIPALLPQIEGTLKDYDYNGNNIKKQTIDVFIDVLLMDKDEYLPVKGLIVDELYESFHWGDNALPELSRHAILHGADVNYNTEINSLRVILIYDMIVQLIIMNSRKTSI